jgi:hypothetical protein
MITNDQILEAAKAAGMSQAENEAALFWYPEIERLYKLAYRQGLLDAAEKCATDSGDQLMNEYHAANIRQMADEVGK